MGAWSYGPFDNDTALDWLHGLEKTITDALVSSDPDVVRAASHITAILTSSTKLFCKSTIAQEAEEALESLLDNQKWIKSWDKKQLIEEEINKDLEVLKSIKGRKNKWNTHT